MRQRSCLDERVIDITDTFDADKFFDIPNYDYTASIPPIEGTTDPRSEWAAYLDEQDQAIPNTNQGEDHE